MGEVFGALCAGGFCIGTYALLASGAGWLAHRRMRTVEADLDRAAAPPDERRYLLYAAASVVWLSAAVISVIGFVKRDWARVGRDACFIFLAHIGLSVLGAWVRCSPR